jgi:anoctamin-10
MELMKVDKSGVIREFTVNQLEDFVPEGMHVDDLLTLAERQTIVRHELENIRALAEDEHIPGYPTYALYEGQSIFQVCVKWKIIMKVYPLHDQEHLKKLGKKWYMSPFGEQPIGESTRKLCCCLFPPSSLILLSRSRNRLFFAPGALPTPGKFRRRK